MTKVLTTVEGFSKRIVWGLTSGERGKMHTHTHLLYVVQQLVTAFPLYTDISKTLKKGALPCRHKV